MAILRDLSVIFLSSGLFLATLVPLVVLGALIYGLGWLMRRDHLPAWIKVAQAYLALGRAYIERAMAAVVQPVIAVSGLFTRIGSILTGIGKVGGDQ